MVMNIRTSVVFFSLRGIGHRELGQVFCAIAAVIPLLCHLNKVQSPLIARACTDFLKNGSRATVNLVP
jgi:hypothetical protein